MTSIPSTASTERKHGNTGLTRPGRGRPKSSISVDQFRNMVIDQFIEPARKRGDQAVELTAARVFTTLGPFHNYSFICRAIDANRFYLAARVQLIDRQGPGAGPGVTWRFLCE